MISFRSNIIKVGAAVLLAAVLHTYICSAFCSIKDQFLSHQETIVDACCTHEHDDQGEQDHKKDCQQDHMAFLKTVGQFHSYDQCPLDKVFECELINLYQKDFNIISLNQDEFFIDFHPPPPKTGIPVLVQSFLI